MHRRAERDGHGPFAALATDSLHGLSTAAIRALDSGDLHALSSD
ncbi:hypothetical protein, partial [Pelomonas sp. KK5]